VNASTRRLPDWVYHPSGEVTATSQWEALAERKVVRPALEALFDQTGISAFLLPLHDDDVTRVLGKPLLERAIGVIYRPETESLSHYLHSRMPGQLTL